ncbi:corA-like mg2+ transporter protein domain-containing protein [Trichoderma breve]|uniref:CorA-like mg2+ transporter protein domain-containing protein n=1 Tax=Trichoderma breve TaxID=2034170 RepID=A0A9W9B4I5_9HYPO|nr:corA-like mg2+ transporter protein domain-containing protein [Trichoderma breve]KAJ4855539.1 corA-like mg2+ transporter protein domain-containing protein [Trichoderma breve]
MAFDDSIRRRERPRRSTGGSEAYFQPPQRARRELTRRDFLNESGDEFVHRRESNDEAEPSLGPMILRSRDTRSSPPPILRQRRTLGRKSSGAELTTEEAVITESPTAFHHAASSDDDDRTTRFRRRRDYDEQDDSRPAREEIIIERRDEDEPRARARYVDAEEDGYLRPMSPIVEDIDAFDDFHFVFPAEDPSKDAELSDLDTPTTESESTQKVERPLSNVITAPGIYSSSYSGTAELGAQHDVNLTFLHDPRGQKQPLFRWLHVRQDIMNFDAFWVQVSRQIHFRDAERKAVANLQAEVKRQCVKTRYNPQGAKVGYMEPRCIQTPIQSSNKKPSEDSHAANWICIPYFHLQQYSESVSTSNTALFPAQTLLQSQYSRSGQQRDMDQAAFISHFRAFWPRKLEFWRKDRLLAAENWAKILNLAEGQHGDVRLKLKIADAPDLLRTFLKQDATANKASQKCPEQSAAAPESLHVFTLLSKSADSSNDSILKDLQEQLSAAEKFLTEKTSYTAQREYKRCELMTRDGVNEQLEKLGTRIEEKKSDKVRRSYEERLDVFNIADTLFQLFFPLTFHGPTTGKYWGALSNKMRMPELDEDDVHMYSTPVSTLKSTLWELAQDIQSFQNLMSFAGKEDRAAMELPHELVTAWLHIVFGLTYAYEVGWYNHMTKAKSLLKEGMQKMVESISAQNLLDRAVMQPTEVMSLIALNLLHDDVGKYDDICDTYSLYLNSLDTDITTKAPSRTYQHRIDLVNQEMTAIKRNLSRQRNIIAMLRNRTSITDGNFMFLNELETASKLSSTDMGGFRSLFLADCANLVDQREYEFRRNTEYAEDLEREITYKMEWTKDRQENAIYAFTLVTIIFLPLSAISSIFGMNTNDIRNMDFDQWLYWVVALPVTVIIIIAGLWWMDELSNATDWLVGKRWRSSKGASRSSGSSMDYDSVSRASEDVPATYRRSRYSRPTVRKYAETIEVPVASMPPPRRRRTSFYKY